MCFGLSLYLSVSHKWMMLHTDSRCFHINQSCLLFRKRLFVSDYIAVTDCNFDSYKPFISSASLFDTCKDDKCLGIVFFLFLQYSAFCISL